MHSVGIVLPALNEGQMLAMTVESILAAADGVTPQIVVVDDGSTDDCVALVREQYGDRVNVVTGGGLGVARARNRGADELDADVLVFMDAHCTVQRGWLERALEILRDDDVGLLGPAFTNLGQSAPRGCGMRWSGPNLETCWFVAPETTHPIRVPLTIGACHIFRRDTFDRVGRYDEQFSTWGFEDVEMCLRVWTCGLSVIADPQMTVAHYFRTARDNYAIPEMGVLLNFLRLVYLHMSPTVIRTILAAFEGYEPLMQAQQVLFERSIFDERQRRFETRERDDLWFFDEINGPLSSAASIPGRSHDVASTVHVQSGQHAPRERTTSLTGVWGTTLGDS
jgi:GT2 family glycosyltransferase